MLLAHLQMTKLRFGELTSLGEGHYFSKCQHWDSDQCGPSPGSNSLHKPSCCPHKLQFQGPVKEGLSGAACLQRDRRVPGPGISPRTPTFTPASPSGQTVGPEDVKQSWQPNKGSQSVRHFLTAQSPTSLQTEDPKECLECRWGQTASCRC